MWHRLLMIYLTHFSELEQLWLYIHLCFQIYCELTQKVSQYTEVSSGQLLLPLVIQYNELRDLIEFRD